jgi:hypothetical protein
MPAQWQCVSLKFLIKEYQALHDYRFDHVHLRSANPSAMADFFETMFAADVTRDTYPAGTLYPGQQRIRMRVGGQTVLIAPAHPNDATGSAPTFPYYGLEHMGLTRPRRRYTVH